MLVASHHVLLGLVPMSHPFSLSQRAASSEQVSTPMAPSSPAPECSPRPKQQHPSPDLVDVLPPSGTTPKATPEGPPSSKQGEVMSLHKALTQSHLEALSQDSSLVRKTREEHFRSHCPNLDNENTSDLSDVFWCMIEMADLLGSAIYKIREAWTG